MSEVVRITVVPRREMITVVNGGLSALCALAGIDREQAGRLQLATEEVFLYSVQTIRKAGLESMVTVRFCHHGQGFKIVLEYPGPKGPLDGCFRAGHLDMPEFKSFEAV
ncbi:MAG: hypothetical protein EOM25_12145, partial [Deltaproteobacteria bacterium]|nr:hypothetical protein [Deltaproteobacteria bacterium]